MKRPTLILAALSVVAAAAFLSAANPASAQGYWEPRWGGGDPRWGGGPQYVDPRFSPRPRWDDEDYGPPRRWGPPPHARGWGPPPHAGGWGPPARVRYNAVCVTSRGNCGLAYPVPSGTLCRCDFNGFRKRGQVP